MQVELGHTLQGDGEDHPQAAQVHSRRLEHVCVAGLGALKNGPVGRQQGQRHHLAVGEEHCRIPVAISRRRQARPSLPCVSRTARGQVAPSPEDQCHLATGQQGSQALSGQHQPPVPYPGPPFPEESSFISV